MGVTKNHIHTEDQIALARLFKALGHPAGIAIVEKLLTHNSLNCKDLGDFIQLAQSTISEHVRQLHDVGILGVTVIGNNAFYYINKIALEQMTDYIDQLFDLIDLARCQNPFFYLKPMYSVGPRNLVRSS